MTTDLTVAKTIIQQLGNKCLVMIGAKKPFGAREDGVSFKIGRNPGGWQWISIKLNGLDLYDVTFTTFRKFVKTKEKVHNNVYCDMLHQLIETETGLLTSLGTMGGEG